ncbi:hypothetical protein EXE58_07205 [Nocardioides seonyuensis]|uniref:Uncharacterized protein n=1 Tax=Nocardioides seonyuensis TaxID=2518371 RepID=A0A4P7IHJ4_9ACTN|nr:hypothetical protein [Nocardioides seonyuensis]QBX55261.1 hypothetical protein EXE58_07205 [Nocardioides seonyuensis]
MGEQVFRCAVCDRALTRSMTQLPTLPVAKPVDEVSYEPTLEVGTWAIDPGPRLLTADGAPAGTLGCLVTNPLDAPDLEPHPEPRRNSGCCGHDGCDGPNRVCPGCDAAVATLSDDCWTLVELRFEPDAVRVVAQE